jgi:hypothetical protein
MMAFWKAETCSIVLLNINCFVVVLWRILIKKFILISDQILPSNNSVSAITPTMMRWEQINTYINFEYIIYIGSLGRAIAQAVSRWLPIAAARGSSPGLDMWDLWWTRWRWGRFSPSISVSPANFHSTNCSKSHPHLSSGVCTIGQKWPQY